jgi:UDP-N-acetylglucosamine--N-acetylmuramyl-(pentapeptide) pyrophosphoryl-undecaprenol N-acetylglucosamine transferase
MTIVVTGAGSGGHITPILAVAHELKKLDPSCNVVYIGQKGDSLSDIPENNPDIDKVYTISAGKLRRYHSTGAKQLLDLPTNLKNVRDGTRVVRGLSQSYRLLGKLKPDAIFIKGGFIGVPVGLAAAKRNIPFITHDSDAIPGLANRIIARWATIHAVALPKEYYSYSPNNTETVGVPISDDYKYVDFAKKEAFKNALGLNKFKLLLLITGGGLGATTINEISVKALQELLKFYPDLGVVHFVGRAHKEIMEHQYNTLLTEEERERVVLKTFVEDFYKYSGAADLIIARAGATNLAEFATQGKACIIIPSPYLVGGHQLKNANALAERRAVKLLDEDSILKNNTVLTKAVSELLESAEERNKLSTELHKFASSDASKRIAMLLLNIGTKK